MGKSNTDILLDAGVVELLSSMDAFFIQQRIRMVEAVTQGCIEQANVYDVFNKETNKRVMIIKEESDGCSRCFCAPNHSIFVKFYMVGSDAPEIKPGEKIDWSYEPSGAPFMTFEREGCDCCFKGACPKPCIGCYACTEGCRDIGTLHAGDLDGKPGEKDGKRERVSLIGESIQPKGGGGFKPVMQMMDRADPSDGAEGKTELFAASRGPCVTGGCSALCCSSPFGVAVADQSMYENSSKLHKQNFGDYATITKIRPKKFSQAMREVFTDSDIFDVTFAQKSVSAQQKANILAHIIHLDYMFFERDGDMCGNDENGSYINICNWFCYGCICPCKCYCKSSS
ncbi:unnamed protein product [Pseudo-nitzschia multistriata]|uniref:Phospholipid scramblase n=1 Tax=Pseudo-nitzschia multistriata TaxID=183589 RepID=A0A448ZA76_9STRA|nr:unnamed protein product [Pseudo-nitzschia multistriata]